MTDRRRMPALLLALTLASLATLGGLAGARTTEGAPLADFGQILSALSTSKKLHFSGVLSQDGTPVQKGPQEIRFSLWTDPTTTDTTLKLWDEAQTVQVRNGGVISVFLGANVPFPEGLFENDLYLGIDLLDSSGAVTTSFPRQELAHVPKAFRAVGASKADGLDDAKCVKCVKGDHVEEKGIGREKIKDRAIQKEQLDDRAVAKGKIDDKAVGKGQLDDKAVGKGQLDDKAVGRDQIDDRAIGRGQLGIGVELDGLPGYSLNGIAPIVWSGSDPFRRIAATIGIDGLPVIAFNGESGATVAHCDDLACTSFTTNALTGLAGFSALAIAIAPNGYPVVASGGDIARCGDVTCASATIESFGSTVSALAFDARGELVTGFDQTAVDVAGHGGIVRVYSSGALTADICPHVLLLQCSNPTSVVLDSNGGDQIALAINAYGGPTVAYTRQDELHIVVCTDPLCAARTSTMVEAISVGAVSVATGRDGRAVIAYTARLGTLGAPTVFVAHCLTTDCSSVSTTIATYDTGSFGPVDAFGGLSITIGRDGLPLIAFEGLSVQVLHCGNVFCVPFARAR